MPFGVAELDGRLKGSLRAGALHEATAGSCSPVDDAAATLFLAGIAAREARAAGSSVLWASCRNDLYAPGLEQAGLAAADVIYAQPRDDAALLAVIVDAVRDGTPSAVVAKASKVAEALAPLPIDLVAESVGYGDVGGFWRVFRSIVGLTPSEYRRRFCRP